MRLVAFLLIITKIFVLFNLLCVSSSSVPEEEEGEEVCEEEDYNRELPSSADKLDSIYLADGGNNEQKEHQQATSLFPSARRPEEALEANNGRQLAHHSNGPYHHSSQLDSEWDLGEEDDNVVAVDLERRSERINPLIEWENLEPRGSFLLNESQVETSGYKKRAHEKSIKYPLFGAQKRRASHGAKRRRGSDTWISSGAYWCHKDCSSAPSISATRSVCASNGHLFGSMCELRRFACRNNIHLSRRPKVHCIEAAKNEQVRIVELKKRCNERELKQMKLLLMREFNSDLDSMFKYFDANADSFIEANELWPRRKLEANKLMYAQVWDDHSSRCKQMRSHLKHEDTKKCWFFLDFAFEPKFPSNPCSLSHLMLFDLRHPSNKFDYDSFRQAFVAPKSSSEANNQLAKQPIRRITQLDIGLGESATLKCLQNLNLSQLELASIEEHENSIEDVETLGVAKCLWTRYNLNVAGIQEAHVSVEEQLEDKEQRIRYELLLHLKDAQLYLSGTYKCACKLSKVSLNYEHLFNLRVMAEPRVHVRPHFQWSLPKSRISFECHYDYIDTTSSDFERLDMKELSDGCSLLLHNNESTCAPPKAHKWMELDVSWLRSDSGAQILDRKKYGELARSSDNELQSNGSSEDSFESSPEEEELRAPISQSSARSSITLASSRLVVEDLELNDTGGHTCRVEVQHALRDPLRAEDEGKLLVQDEPRDESKPEEARNLWMFHENGISVYRLQNDDGQEMELVSELNGHSLVSGQVDGNWNQLTLCGGLNPEQAVICEWSDNGLFMEVSQGESAAGRSKRYVYVGQPNLNRIVVMEGSQFEIVAIINTEPQPRKLHLYKPNKVHLSKWLRRRLSPSANAQWTAAIAAGHAHPLRSTPDESRVYSSRVRARRLAERERFSANQKPPTSLVQHDVWLLCYGQPLVVDPAGDEHLVGEQSFNLSQQAINNAKHIQPFTPRLLSSGSSGGWQAAAWPSKESKLRNRKSVHIIQSTFLAGQSAHRHDNSNADEAERNQTTSKVEEFKRSAVLTTHHIYSRYLNGAQLDLIQDLHVPQRPFALERDDRHKIHHAYVTHYNDRRLFRVSMDEYRYDREIDLQNCDPINLMTTAQGLLVVQCRAPITHNLIGQLVLDQLSSSRIEFNANIRAQDSYLSPDSRYLVSIYTNTTPISPPLISKEANRNQQQQQQQQQQRKARSSDWLQKNKQSIVYVQSVSVSGLKLQYEIKTALEINQCAFVWKDGYYAAIFVSTNRKDQQSEILSLRLADGRLELMARVPGLISVTRHKDQLIVSPELRLAALSTNQGTFVVDLEDNRVSQSLRHHQSPPTLLWV